MVESDPKGDDELKTCPECGKGMMRKVRHTEYGATRQEQNSRTDKDVVSDVQKRRCDNCGHTEIAVTVKDDVTISETAVGVVKTIDLTESPQVVGVKKEADEKEVIDVDINNLQSGKVYRVNYQGKPYAVEKLPSGKLAFYEVMD